jgi:hypothetical protein
MLVNSKKSGRFRFNDPHGPAFPLSFSREREKERGKGEKGNGVEKWPPMFRIFLNQKRSGL